MNFTYTRAFPIKVLDYLLRFLKSLVDAQKEIRKRYDM